MPFTFSHPAIVLPFRIMPKRWISLTGLVVGSLAPDFEKFIKMSPGNSFSHTWKGVFLFNLPLGLLLCFMFHCIVRNTLINHLPMYFEKRLVHTQHFNWGQYFRKRYFIVIISIVTGAISHITWDSITHKRGLIVRLIPKLEQVITIAGFEQPIYSLLDLMSTGFGGLFVLLTIAFLPVRYQGTIQNSSKSKYWIIVSGVTIMVVFARALLGLGKEWYWELIITSLSGLFIGIIMASLIAKYKLRIK